MLKILHREHMDSPCARRASGSMPCRGVADVSRLLIGEPSRVNSSIYLLVDEQQQPNVLNCGAEAGR